MIIDENLAKRAKENYSFSDYEKGSATREYNTMIANAERQIEEAKQNVSDEGKVKLDNLLIRYKSKLANWTNKHNANGASHVSVMIAGPSNYNMRKHEKYVARESKLYEEYREIQNLDSKINKIINSENIIRTDDKNALEKLRNKLEEALKEHEGYKEYNKKARKEGRETYPSCVLSNSNQRIKNIKDRISQLERLEEQKATTGNKEIDMNGIKIIDNLEANRLQIIFDFKPDADIRNKLKKHGFRWSPSYGAWQRYRGLEAERMAKEIVSNI